jgi:hypothetical protein
MENWQIAVIVIAAAAFFLAVGWLLYERNRSRRLRQHFGREYDRKITEVGDRRRAESDLTQREARVRGLTLRPLDSSDRENFRDRWRMCQSRFVDSPSEAVDEADRLLDDVMHARGYPMDDRNDRLDDLCAAHPEHAPELREAHEILVMSRAGRASTEELRTAFVCYRSLFGEILGGHDEKLRRAS